MANLNKVHLIGNLTRDPDLRYTPKGTAVADITLAINRVWNNEQNQRQEETTFVDCILWGRQAELAQQFLAKGRGAYIEGRLQTDTWDDKATGQKRSKLKVVVESLQFLPHKGDADSSARARETKSQREKRTGAGHADAPSSSPPTTPASEDEYGDEDDIPF